MQLQHGGRHHRGQWAFNELRHGISLLFARGQQQQVPRPLNGAEALGDHVHGDVLKRAEEPRVVCPRLRMQRRQSGQGVEGASRFVESDVSVGSDSQKLDANPTRLFNRPLIFQTGGIGVLH